MAHDLLERGWPIMMTGPGAEAWATAHGHDVLDPVALVTDCARRSGEMAGCASAPGAPPTKTTRPRSRPRRGSGRAGHRRRRGARCAREGRGRHVNGGMTETARAGWRHAGDRCWHMGRCTRCGVVHRRRRGVPSCVRCARGRSGCAMKALTWALFASGSWTWSNPGGRGGLIAVSADGRSRCPSVSR
ncbi:MAG: hypothetical protein CM15mP128_3520 [Methanobacteriota archaeon]|nr:MAG: hypothetical protein CM15mP128_3520 [Euryarchaeota archaeon]